MKVSISRITALGIAAIFTMPAAHATVVTANSPGGDAYTFAGGSPGGGQAVGTSGWYYNNVRSNAVIGIDGDYPRSGNGSVSFTAPAGSKADIEYLPGAVKVGSLYASTSSLGLFSTLQSMSYDWYRDATSAAAANLHPSLRVLLDRDGNLATTNDRGGLVFERSYNTPGAVPVDAWQSDTVSASTKMWNFSLGLGSEYDLNGNGYAFDSSLADWQAFMPNALIIGFSSGVGSGWGAYNGAVDNISWTIAGLTTTTNFERSADVPEPASLGLLAIGLAGLALRRRKPN
ncbi:PEP-CTERM sorting domain-containing protein [Massilia sp.]|uniref:PEP-CTERM sorting domain-containing protein n=1 Tax=Massilia sp. TaxID=1882437 RepID=UPI00391D2053